MALTSTYHFNQTTSTAPTTTFHTMYASGDGVEQSYSKAREWFTKAAAQGQEEAINALKQFDEHGI